MSKPTDGVYCRLGVSKIHGIGVIAIVDIPKGIDPFKHDYGTHKGDYKRYKVSELMKGLKPAYKKLYDDFCVFEGGDKYVWVPKSFNSISVGWYLNNSENPNMETTTGDVFITKRKIKAGEELTVCYESYSDH